MYLMRERRAGVKSSLWVEEDTEGGVGGLDGKYTNTATSSTPVTPAPEYRFQKKKITNTEMEDLNFLYLLSPITTNT